jgi:hypothetical protein
LLAHRGSKGSEGSQQNQGTKKSFGKNGFIVLQGFSKLSPKPTMRRRVRSHIEHEHPTIRSEYKHSRLVLFWLTGMEQLFDGLFWVPDLGAILTIVLLGLKLLQETETRRSGRVPRSAVLGHAETLLAAMRHILAIQWKKGERKTCSGDRSIQTAMHHFPVGEQPNLQSCIFKGVSITAVIERSKSPKVVT